jgi:glycosyltransferase involved in cell wall biosynthesis
MRVLVINWQDWTHPFAGGAEFHLREVFGRIAGLGHRVDLLCAAYPGAPPDDQLEGINILRRGRRYRLFNYVVPGIYRQVLRHNDYDVIVDDLNKIPFLSPLFADKPVVALVHHLLGRTAYHETNPAFATYVWLGERPISRAYRHSAFIAVSNSTEDELVRRGVRREQITVIPNGVSDAPFDELITKEKSPTPLFVYLGRLKRYKAIELILEAFALLSVEHPDARLVIAGEGDHRSQLERRAAASGSDRIEFVGWVGEEDKWELLRSAWALCYTSPNEGWGISSLEAQRVGTIAIVSDAPGLRDTIVAGETGWAVPHGDVRSLMAAMKRAIAEPDERHRLELAGIERAKRYTWDAAATETLAVLQTASGKSA